jgi:hypothetical protein
MEKEAKKVKKQVPVFLKILFGVIGIYLITNFFGGSFFGLNKGNSSGLAVASLGVDRAVEGQSFSEPSSEMLADKVPMMTKSAPAGRMMDEGATMPMPTSDRQGAPVPDVDKKIIKNGSVELKVDNAEKVADKITDIVKGFGGDIFSSNSRRQSNGNLRGSLTVKVPVDKFDEAMAAVKKAGEKVIFESVNASDVTMDYIDLQARLNNKKAEEETFKKLLDKTGGLKDILSVTRELTRVRSEIDSLEGQLKYMTNQTSMSTINVTLTEFVQATTDRDSWEPWRVVKKSVHNLIINTQNFSYGVIEFIIERLPFLIVTALLIFGGYKGAMKIYRKFRK